MRLAAHLPQYMPWLGYFDKLDRADLFVLLDTVALWNKAGIRVEFQDFHHPVYARCHAGFEACLSAIDLLMQRGPGSAALLRDPVGRAA